MSVCPAAAGSGAARVLLFLGFLGLLALGACNAPPQAPSEAPVTCSVGEGGFAVGDGLADYTFPDCDQKPVALRDLCGARAGLIVNFYGWCTTCYRMVETAVSLSNKDRARGLSTMIVVVEGRAGVLADAAYCRMARDYFHPNAVVVYDPERRIESYGTTDLAMITDPSARIVFRRQDADPEIVASAVEAQLARAGTK